MGSKGGESGIWEEVGLKLVLERTLSEDGEKTSVFSVGHL